VQAHDALQAVRVFAARVKSPCVCRPQSVAEEPPAPAHGLDEVSAVSTCLQKGNSWMNNGKKQSLQ
jgi:hypothetical protein